MARLLADNFEGFNGTITHQRRRGALPKVVQGGGLRLVHVSPPRKRHHKQHVTVKPVLLRLIYRKTGIIETYLP